jgi:hypothetical protein
MFQGEATSGRELVGRGAIDRWQSQMINVMNELDFAGPYNAQVEKLLTKLRDSFISELNNSIKGGRLNGEQVSELKRAIDAIKNMSIKELFQSGQNGYSGKGMDPYR